MLLIDKPTQLNRQKMKLETIEELKREINSYEMVALLKACYNYFDIEIEKPKALWVTLTIMKWTYLYGTRTKPVKPLTVKAFQTLFEAIMEFDPDHISNYMKSQGKLGGQNKIPRLTNDRNIADQLTKYLL